MKNKKSVIASLAFVLLISVFTTGFIWFRTRCELNGANVCFDRNEGLYKIETGASVSVQVESEEMATYLKTTWDELHPEQSGAITTVVKSPLSVEEMTQGFPTDVILTSQNNAMYFIKDALNMGSDVSERVLYYSPKTLEDAMNLKGTYFVPNSAKGWLFVYNKTLAQELGLDLTDANEDGVPDSFENWEDLWTLRETIKAKGVELFPLTFTDQVSFYPFLTGGKWRLNFTNDGSDPGFDHNEFLAGLNFIEDYSKVLRTDETVTAETLAWEYETAFYERRVLFTMASDWMQTESYAAKTGDEYVYSQFPKYKNHNLAPLAEVDGYMVSANAKYPSASAEVLRILRDPKAATVYKSADEKVFVYNRNNLSDLEVDQQTLNKIRAYSYSDTLPVLALNENAKILSKTVLYDIDIMPMLRDLFNGKITKEKAQEGITELATDWRLEKSKPEVDTDCDNVCE